MAYSSSTTARRDGVTGSKAGTPRRVGPAAGGVSLGVAQPPELAAGPMSQSCPTSLFLSPLAATAPDSWRQSREPCVSKTRCLSLGTN